MSGLAIATTSDNRQDNATKNHLSSIIKPRVPEQMTFRLLVDFPQRVSQWGLVAD